MAAFSCSCDEARTPCPTRKANHSTSLSQLRSVLSRSNSARFMQADALLGHGVGDGVPRRAHRVLVDRADAADAQRVDLGQLPRVEHEAFGAHAVVELLELVARVGRGMEGD